MYHIAGNFCGVNNLFSLIACTAFIRSGKPRTYVKISWRSASLPSKITNFLPHENYRLYGSNIKVYLTTVLYTRMHQTYANFARVDQFATIKSQNLSKYTRSSPERNSDRKGSIFLLTWLIRKGFSSAKYSSNTYSDYNHAA